MYCWIGRDNSFSILKWVCAPHHFALLWRKMADVYLKCLMKMNMAMTLQAVLRQCSCIKKAVFRLQRPITLSFQQAPKQTWLITTIEDGTMTFHIMTLCIMTLSTMTLSIMTLSIMTLSIMTFGITINLTWHSA